MTHHTPQSVARTSLAGRPDDSRACGTSQLDFLLDTPAPTPVLTDTPRARRTDPVTSHEAAEQLKASGAIAPGGRC